MTEDQAIERIAQRIHEANAFNVHAKGTRSLNHDLAQAAWNEMKAIARENPAGPVPAWRNMTREEALRERRIRLEPREPYHFV